jgi:hypothetical protein
MLKKKLNRLTSFFILFSAISLGIEASFHSENSLKFIFWFIDLVILVFFSIELYIRIKFRSYSFSLFISNLPKSKNSIERQDDSDSILEEWLWIIFDSIILIFTYLSFFRHFIEHPQVVLVLRLFRIFRVFRLFELSNSLKTIEKKIISTYTTIITFLSLLALILYSYSIVGMFLYDFQKTESIDFSGVYTAMTGLFLLMTNDWANTLTELRNISSVPSICTDLYLFSFFIFSVIITLNVFLAVMTSQIEDRLKEQIKGIRKKEEEIEFEMHRIDSENNYDIESLNKKIDEILIRLDKSK